MLLGVRGQPATKFGLPWSNFGGESNFSFDAVCSSRNLDLEVSSVWVVWLQFVILVSCAEFNRNFEIPRSTHPSFEVIAPLSLHRQKSIYGGSNLPQTAESLPVAKTISFCETRPLPKCIQWHSLLHSRLLAWLWKSERCAPQTQHPKRQSHGLCAAFAKLCSHLCRAHARHAVCGHWEISSMFPMILRRHISCMYVLSRISGRRCQWQLRSEFLDASIRYQGQVGKWREESRWVVWCSVECMNVSHAGRTNILIVCSNARNMFSQRLTYEP